MKNINQKLVTDIVKDIDIKYRTFYFFNDMNNIKNFGLNNIKLDENSYKNILITILLY